MYLNKLFHHAAEYVLFTDIYYTYYKVITGIFTVTLRSSGFHGFHVFPMFNILLNNSVMTGYLFAIFFTLYANFSYFNIIYMPESRLVLIKNIAEDKILIFK